jgi:hypothetical protein
MKSSYGLGWAGAFAAGLLHAADPRAIPADARYAGSAACASCHHEESKAQASTPMGTALETVAQCEILRDHPSLSFHEDGYSSRIVRDADKSTLTVSNGANNFSTPILWVFGKGQAGQTYVFERDGAFYESRLSYYQSIGGLDITMGSQNRRPESLLDYAGRRMSAAETRACFGCHSTGAVRKDGIHWDSLVPGIACENCHGPSADHVAAMRAGKPLQGRMPRLGELTTEEVSDFCGSCHRTWSDISVNGPRGVGNVRFQPYRLTNSKCYDASDRRIGCVACHNPHQPTARDAAFYDAKCEACHDASAHAKTCPVAKRNCASCHMPKVELPGSHHEFTDHRIRIARAGSPYPD